MATQAWKDAHQEDIKRYRREHYYRNREHYIAAATAQKLKKRQEMSEDEHFRSYLDKHPTKICRTCGVEKSTETDFYFRTSNGRRYPNYECAKCQNERQERRDTQARERHRDRQRQRKKVISKMDRRDPNMRAYFIVNDSRKNDKKHNRECDLTIDFVQSLISGGCCYCGGFDQMVLDRIDNTVGHVQTNVNPCCYRCNTIRGNMPYQAWLVVSEGVRQARELGLFGEWNSRHHAYV